MYINISGTHAIVKKLEEAFARAMKEPAYVNGMEELRLSVTYCSGKDVDAHVAQSHAYFSNLLKEMEATK